MRHFIVGLRPGAVLLGVLGIAMLAVGVWVEDRDAVAVPLVILGAFVVVASVVIERWADIEEMSVSQSGLTFKRRAPTVEELTEGGVPEEVAKQLFEWMDDLLTVLPKAIDARVDRALKKHQVLSMPTPPPNSLLEYLARPTGGAAVPTSPPDPAPGRGAATPPGS
jgi:hypothetical protein